MRHLPSDAAALSDQLLAGDRRALARAISYVEDDHPLKGDLLARLYPHAGRAYTVGVTGAPGSGKSSLINQMVFQARREGLRVGVVAVDPTSPFTGGAFLGDRVRMLDHTLDPDVFIRSMSARGSLGGLARTTWEVMQVLDAAGYGLILVETVGVGQSEWAIAQVADTTLLVLTPASGDSIQTIKAGVMEIADLFVVNKADLPGADRAQAEVRATLQLGPKTDWTPPVLPVVSTEGEGIDAVWEGILGHRRFLEGAGLREERRRRQLQHELDTLLGLEVHERLQRFLAEGPQREATLDRISRREEAPTLAARRLVDLFLDNPPHGNGRRGNDG
ncbi:GTPase [Limnochorda pilosa]|uniref:GTPase n=1 Tax=Limnochorda pilosa TaxID=1555112 RepID=A0A0K2SIJ1_LIMPI|nr:GTPase [Limnochorda pilosa]